MDRATLLGGRAMDFTETPEQALATARRAADAMTLHGVVPHPRNYALWYAYCAGVPPELVRAVDAAVAAGRPFTEARCASFHARFLAEPAADPTWEAASESVRRSVLRAMEYVGAAHRGASDYGRTIEEVSGRLDAAAEQDEFALVLTQAAEETRRFVSFNRALEENLAQSSREIAEVREHLEALRREGRTDAVTGLANRRVFDIALKESVVLAEHDKRPLSVIVMDVDNFQTFRGSFGERVGDQVLRLIGRSVTEAVRGQDTVARYGEQSFAAILPDTGLPQAEATAESIRVGLAARSVVNRRTQTSLGQVTLSLGIAEWRSGEAPADVIRRAGTALHEAKAQGRNRAVAAS
ncbi:GGDEF domain-containing protein [Oleispirillum naphthae]|uniref:GGDEF domain-containing protein n=1 Tax=Oleispirillum naphthae TaxID=2838853 RepID=UPI003082478E